MRTRYCVTSSRDVTRPSFIAACISGIVASTTVKDCPLAGTPGPGVRVCAHKIVVADNRKAMENGSFIVADSIPTKQKSYRDSCADCAGPAARAKDLNRSHPGHDQAVPSRRKQW